MVIRKRLRAFLTAAGLYVAAGLLIGYFGVHAYSGAHGLRAKQDLLWQANELAEELKRLKLEHAQLAHRVSLLRSDQLDPDLLDERARAMLHYAHPHDLILLLKPQR